MLLPHDRDALVSVSSLPYPFQPLFKYRYFNAVQSECFHEAYLSDENMVVSAPTGSGKTGIFELCILRLLSKSLTSAGQFNHLRGSERIVYIAPMKALVQEKSREWKEKFGHGLGLVCQELTGDSDILKPSQMQETDVILTTPEKFDSITRNHRDHGGVGFFGDIALVLIDEVHLLNDSRGACLEAVVSRIKMLCQSPELKSSPIGRIRFVAVSATIPNIEDLAEWLRVPKRGIKRFGEEMRPVQLVTKVYGYGAAKNDYLFEKRLQNFLFDVIVQHSGGKPTLVFCCTRKGTQDASLILAETVSKPGARNPFIKSQEQFDRLQLAAKRAVDKHIQTCILRGVAYHNGGLGPADRALVEGLFLQCDLQVLCTTSTLAQGVNLPAHLVVIKSTQFYNKDKGRYVEHERSTLLQMCGRAGRPQFDDSGVVVLMTRNETVHLYENILSGSEPVESELLPSIAEHLNAEIVLMTVSDVGLAIEWLKCSYLYVRMRKLPEHYKIEKGITEDQMVKHMKGICLQTVNELAKYGMVWMDEYGFTLKPLEPGKLMAKYYLNFETMKTITEISDQSGMAELLRALAKAQELSWIQLRRHEKKLLNAINQDTSGRIKFHVLGPNGKTKKRIQTYDEKIYLLVNDVLSDEPSSIDFTMTQDVNGIGTNGARIVRCMGDYFKFIKRYKETKNSLLLAKCLRQRLWDDTAHQLKQLPGIGAVTVKTFQTAGIDSFEKLAGADPRQIELITGRRFPYGDQVKESLTALPPKVVISIRQTGLQVGAKNEFTLELTRTSEPKTSSKWHMADLIIGDDSENLILFHERISPYPVAVYSNSSISAALICEEYVGIDHLTKAAATGIAEATKVSTGNQGAQQRERKKQSAPKTQCPPVSPPVVLSAVQPSSLKQSSTNQAVEKKVEFLPVLVSPKFLQDHSLANQNSLKQLSRSARAKAASDVGERASRIVMGPPMQESEAKFQQGWHRSDTIDKRVDAGNDAETGIHDASPESYDLYDEWFHNDVSSQQQMSSSHEMQTDHSNAENGEAQYAEFSPGSAHSSFSDNGSVIPFFANATQRRQEFVRFSGSTAIQNKPHYSPTRVVPDGNFRKMNNGTTQSSEGYQVKRRLVLPGVPERPLISGLHEVAQDVQFRRESIRNGQGFGCFDSKNESFTELPKCKAGTSATDSATFFRASTEDVQFRRESMRNNQGFGCFDSKNESFTELPKCKAGTSATDSATFFRASTEDVQFRRESMRNNQGFPTACNFRNVTREANEGEHCWVLGANSYATNPQTTPASASCSKSVAVQEHHLHPSKVAPDFVEGKSIFSFLFE
ncbi:unnamed protein product [Calypogeia fissa]